MDLKEKQVEALLESIFEKYGYDFRNYARASIERRLEYFSGRKQILDFRNLQDSLLGDPPLFEDFVRDMTVQVTEMFRDPYVYRYLRAQVLPILATYPRIKIWHAGCSSGQEVYSMAIMLQEEGLLERSLLYATDLNERALEIAKKGCFPVKTMQANTKNYLDSGGKESFSQYYKAVDNHIQMSDQLKHRMVFSFHNLSVDNSFAEVHLVMCRNVLIYFNETLQNRVLRLFADSLIREGFLVLGNKETLDEQMHSTLHCFSFPERIYRDAG